MIDNTTAKRRNVKKRIQKPAMKRKKTPRPKLTIKRSDLFTVIWLVLLFPVGLTRMWKPKCTWNKGIKYAISGLCAALCVAVLFVPSPYHKTRGGVEIVAEDPEVEIYGPSAPQTMINGYTSAQQESVVIDSVAASSTTITVYAAEGAKCYHLGDCKFAFASAKKLTVYEAYFLGYKPCGACEPPVYDPVTGLTTESAKETEETVTESVIVPENNENTDVADGSEFGDFDDGSSDDIV